MCPAQTLSSPSVARVDGPSFQRAELAGQDDVPCERIVILTAGKEVPPQIYSSNGFCPIIILLHPGGFLFSPFNLAPYWNRDGDDRALAVVCLSGMYDFTDRTTDSAYPNVPGDPIDSFREKIENYTGTCARFGNGGVNQWSSSPVAQLQTFTVQKPFRPMYFIHARFDTIPYHQLFDSPMQTD